MGLPSTKRRLMQLGSTDMAREVATAVEGVVPLKASHTMNIDTGGTMIDPTLTDREWFMRKYGRRLSDEAWDRFANHDTLWVITDALDPGSGQGSYNERGQYEVVEPVDGRLAVVQFTSEGIIVDWFIWSASDKEGPVETYAVDWFDIAAQSPEES